MSIKEIIGKFSSLNVAEQRSVSDEYAELVFFNKDSEQWNKALTDIFGPALKPAGAKPSKEVLALTEDFGGIFDNQSLFKKELGGSLALAMLWPWQDDSHTTLKIVCLKK